MAMTEPKLDAILGRAVRDSAFREKLLTDPAGAAEGYDLTAQELEELKEIDREVATTFFSDVSEVQGFMMSRGKDWCTEKSCCEGG